MLLIIYSRNRNYNINIFIKHNDWQFISLFKFLYKCFSSYFGIIQFFRVTHWAWFVNDKRNGDWWAFFLFRCFWCVDCEKNIDKNLACNAWNSVDTIVSCNLEVLWVGQVEFGICTAKDISRSLFGTHFTKKEIFKNKVKKKAK